MKNTIILVLSLLVIGLGIFLIFDKVINKKIDNDTNKTNNVIEQDDNDENNIKISNDDIKLKSLNIEKYIVDENGVNTKISVAGKIDLEFDENKYEGVTISGYCLDSNDTKYIITGPSDGRALYHSGMSDLSLSEDLMSNVVYKDGTTKPIRENSWKDVSLKKCYIEKIIGFINESIQSSDNESIDYNSLIGIWYENESAKNYPNSNQLTVKSADTNKLVLDMYFTRTAGFTNATVELKGNTGEFESVSDNGANDSGELGSAKFKIIVNDDTIKLIILQTDIHYLQPSEYTFTYVNK